MYFCLGHAVHVAVSRELVENNMERLLYFLADVATNFHVAIQDMKHRASCGKHQCSDLRLVVQFSVRPNVCKDFQNPRMIKLGSHQISYFELGATKMIHVTVAGVIVAIVGRQNAQDSPERGDVTNISDPCSFLV